MTDQPNPDRPWRVGCVSFLNARPLIHGLDADPLIEVDQAVPSALLNKLLDGQVDVALCPTIDYQRAARSLRIVPAGAIGCDGPTLTVRLFSRVPFQRITAIHTDTDSHSSVALLRIIMLGQFGLRPTLYDLRPTELETALEQQAEALLLIGDKVVTAADRLGDYPHQLDLGEAWKALTGLPFVFAVWMALERAPLGDLPQRLATCRHANVQRIGRLVEQYAGPMGWPDDLATDYLSNKLRFEVGQQQVRAIKQFHERAAALGLVDAPPRDLVIEPTEP
jgi:chorismate dehydratase